jgi:hypothetical protein
MIIDILTNPMVWWLFGTAVLFTFVGRWMNFKNIVEQVTAATIDSLIQDGYLKTRGTGKDMEILKHTEWCEKDVDT